MASQQGNIVFDDIFTVTGIDVEGKKFDRVSRLVATSESHGMHLALDYNTELYPLTVNARFTLTLATSLSRSGEADDSSDSRNVWRPDNKGRAGIEADYDYVMYGRVYKFDDGTAENVTAYASFGGLLMALTGSFRHMQGITIGENIYLLMRQ
ncbi:RNA polymerase [Clavulina sp. PMI_390]|nr:RNA polymerase [Clavulina sp. PMI_390]